MSVPLILLLISNIFQWCLILLILRGKTLPWIKLEWDRTFFGNVRYGFRLMFWRKTGPYSSQGIPLIKFRWANPDKLNDGPRCKPKCLWAKPVFWD